MNAVVNLDGTADGAVAERIEAYLDAEENSANPEQQEAQQPTQETEQPVQEAQEPQGDAGEQEQEAEPQKQEPESEAQVDESAPEHYSLAELAEHLETDSETLMSSVLATVKVNGEEKQVDLQELQKGYQMEADYRQKTGKLADERRAFEAQQAEMQAMQNQVAQERAMYAQMLQQTMAQATPPDPNLINSDPVEYMRQDAEYRRVSEENQRKQVELQAINQQSQAEQERQHQAYLQSQMQELTRVIPDWFGPDGQMNQTAQAERAEMRNFLQGSGYSAEEIGMLNDARTLGMLRDAMRYRNMSKAAPEAKKKTLMLKRVQKPGAALDKSAADADKRAANKRALRKSGSVDDAAKMLLDAGLI